MNKARWRGARDHKLEKLAIKMHKHAQKMGYDYVTMFTLEGVLTLWAKEGEERTVDEYLITKEQKNG